MHSISSDNAIDLITDHKIFEFKAYHESTNNRKIEYYLEIENKIGEEDPYLGSLEIEIYGYEPEFGYTIWSNEAQKTFKSEFRSFKCDTLDWNK